MKHHVNLQTRLRIPLLLTVGWVLLGQHAVQAAPDILIADFDLDTYGDWTTEGTAFGDGPIPGFIGDDWAIGYRGQGVVSSYHGGDSSTGMLKSPPFKIERSFINFLIGGGNDRDATCMQLLIDDNVVRTATGANSDGQPSRQLSWKWWDVAEFRGKQAIIRVVDRPTSSYWGSINVDHIYQSDDPMLPIKSKTREFLLEHRFLIMPIKNHTANRWLNLVVDGKVVRNFGIGLALDDPDFWVYLDVRPFQGQRAQLNINNVYADELAGFKKIVSSDTFPGEAQVYKEKLRPQLHFSSRRGWINDPNGMVYYDGEYHLFYQHNPFGWTHGNMTWGHAVSTDMLHWKELGDAIHPDELGTIYSGTAIVDKNNTTGFQTGSEKPIVCIYTSAGGTNPLSKGQPYTQSIAYSNDRGRAFIKYGDNPVQGHIRGRNRDPKVLWYEPLKKWVIVLYIDSVHNEGGPKNNKMAFFTSDDLKSWEFQSELESFVECPELFQLAVDDNKDNKKWVLCGANGAYFIGEFDGHNFKPDGDAIEFNYGNCFYASQTFNNMPAKDGRRVQISWGRISIPGMPFNQMMNFPVVLSLRSTVDGVRMFPEPVREIESLYDGSYGWYDQELSEDNNPLVDISGELFDIQADIDLNKATQLVFTIRGTPVVYDRAKSELCCQENVATVRPVNGRLRLRMLVDRTSIEIFANDGAVYMPMGVLLGDRPRTLTVATKGGPAKIKQLNVYPLKSIWH